PGSAPPRDPCVRRDLQPRDARRRPLRPAPRAPPRTAGRSHKRTSRHERNPREYAYSILTSACEDATGWPRLPPARTCSDGKGPTAAGLAVRDVGGKPLFPPTPPLP